MRDLQDIGTALLLICFANMAQISSFDAPVKVASNDLIDSTVGIDPAILEFPNENLINVPQYDLFIQFSTINNFTKNWEMDNKFQQFNTFNNVENISQNKIGNHLPKSSHTMRLWQRRMNSHKKEKRKNLKHYKIPIRESIIPSKKGTLLLLILQ